MRFALQIPDFFQIVRITDNGNFPDTLGFGLVFTLAQARAWVNKGAIGGSGESWFPFVTLPVGDYTVCGVCM